MIYIDDIPVPVTMFPDGTSQVWKLPSLPLKNVHTIKWEFSHEGEFMHVAQLKDLLDACGRVSELQVDYLPYARQDKDITNQSTFALHTFAKLLNTLKFSAVKTLDAHSEVAGIIENHCDYIPYKDVRSLARELICFPDDGARRRYDYHMREFPSISATKTRNPTSGLIKLSLSADLKPKIKDRRVLIVDDICDGGMTFILLAQELLKYKPKSIELYVTHGIFSKGTRCLFDAGISRIYTHKGEVTRRYGADNV